MRNYIKYCYLALFLIFFIQFRLTAKTENNERKGIGFWALDYEKECGFKVDKSAYLLLDSIVNDCKKIILKQDIYSEKEIIKILKVIGLSIRKYNIKYDTLILYSQALINKKFICKDYTLTYLTVGENLSLPLFLMIAPEHSFVIWKDAQNEVYWETTDNLQSSKKLYIDEMNIPSEVVNSGIFFNCLDFYKSRYLIYEYIAHEKHILNDFNGCITNCNKSIELNPYSSIAFNNRGYAKYALGQKEESILDFTNAIEFNPRYSKAYLNRGSALYDLGDIQGAIEDFNKAIEIEPNLSQAYYNRGIARGVSGDDIGACQDMKKAASLGNTAAIDMYNMNCR